MGSNDTSPLSLDADEIIKEAFAVSQGEAVSIMEEGMSVQTLAESYESYIQSYQNSWTSSWDEGITSFENEVKDWQETVLQNFIQAAKQATPQAQPQPQQPEANAAEAPSQTPASGSPQPQSGQSKPKT